MAAPSALAVYTNFDVGVDVIHRVLKLCGEVDLLTAPVLLDAAEMITGSVGDVTIDLADVSFASSALVNALIKIRADQDRQGAGLWLVNEPSCVRRLFVACGFTEFGRSH